MNVRSLVSFRHLDIPELVFTTVSSVAIGVVFWGWTFLDALVSPFLATFGFRFLFAGFWMVSCVFAPFVIRKPGVAILASVFAAAIEGLLARWGLTAVLWGLAQGLGAELVFAALRYRVWNRFSLCLASMAATAGGYVLSYVHGSYGMLSLSFNVVQFAVALGSSILLSGLFTYSLVTKLVQSGLLTQFAISATR